MTEIITLFYLAVGFLFLHESESQGLLADALFSLFWPYYVLRHLWKGY